MINSKEENSELLPTILHGKLTKLTEDEVELLYEYRTLDNESRKEVQVFIDNLKSYVLR